MQSFHSLEMKILDDFREKNEGFSACKIIGVLEGEFIEKRGIQIEK